MPDKGRVGEERVGGEQPCRKGAGGAGDSRLNASQQRAQQAVCQQANHILGCIHHSLASWSSEVTPTRPSTAAAST